MSFYIDISERTLKFGGMKSIAKDWEFVSQSSGRTFKEPDGTISSPIGAWVIGSAVKTSFVMNILRMKSVWSEDELVKIAGEFDVRLFVATYNRFYTFRNWARTYKDYENGSYSLEHDCTQADVASAKAGRVPQYWATNETNYF